MEEKEEVEERLTVWVCAVGEEQLEAACSASASEDVKGSVSVLQEAVDIEHFRCISALKSKSTDATATLGSLFFALPLSRLLLAVANERLLQPMIGVFENLRKVIINRCSDVAILQCHWLISPLIRDFDHCHILHHHYLCEDSVHRVALSSHCPLLRVCEKALAQRRQGT